MPQAITLEHLTGRDESFLVQCAGQRLHADIVADWRKLSARAWQAGFELTIASAYRSFDRQLAIWNDKARGLRPVLDACEKPIDTSTLNDDELLFAILRWSALPGASRHHWGTDLDIYDQAVMPADNGQLQLCAAEVEGDGPFVALHNWLDEHFLQSAPHAFYRPYTQVRAASELGVSAERWHISHRTVSCRYEALMSKDLLYTFYQSCSQLALKGLILKHFDTIYERFIRR